MIPRTLSASAIETYELCPARYEAEYIRRVPQPSSTAASLGTVCHDALEQFVVDELHVSGGTLGDLHALYEEKWWDHFSTKDPKLYDQGKEMLANWHGRQDWFGKEVVMAEVKERFPLTLPGRTGDELGSPDNPVPVTYIWDRCDRHDDGTIEVVDYKSYGQPLPVDVMKERIQPRLYALAAFIRFKDEAPPAIWVTYDMLRYDEIGVKFTRDECIETWNYLQRVAARILADEPNPDDDDDTSWPKESINNNCNWCVRQGTCQTLLAYASEGGVQAITSLEEAIDRRQMVAGAAKALYEQRDALDAFIVDYYERNALDPTEKIDTGSTIGGLKGNKRRSFPEHKVAEILGGELMKKYGSLTLKVIDELLKGDEITDEQKERIQAQISKKLTSVTVTTKPSGEFTS